MKYMRLNQSFFERDAANVAPELAGKVLCRRTDAGVIKLRIAETEIYRGEEDTACHAHKGRTPRTEVMYGEGGTLYIYLCYGIHWLMNIVTGERGQPQCVLLRAGEAPWDGPAKLTKRMGNDKRFNGASICGNDELWIEDDGKQYQVAAMPRVGIAYAAEADRERLWRYKIEAEVDADAL